MRNVLMIFFLLISGATFARLHFAGIFTDHAVLQRGKPIPVWGWAKSGEKIKVLFNGQQVQSTANDQGKWLVTLTPVEAGGPYTLTAKTTKETVTLSDIMVGEVWICSGQSNMEWPLEQTDNAKAAIAAATNGLIRQIKIPNTLSLHENNDIPETQWVSSSPQTAAQFTAVGYYFALSLFEQLKVPIGLINSSWGGSQVEGWISKQAMLSSEELKTYAAHMPATWEASEPFLEKRLTDFLKEKAGKPFVMPAESEMLAPGYDFSTWPSAGAPGQWDWAGVWAFRGQGYMQRIVEMDETLADKPSVLNLGTNDSKYTIFINGRQVAEGQQQQVRVELAASTWKPGENILLIKQAAQITPEWMGMGIHGSPDQVYLGFGDTRISLSGGNWRIMPSIKEPHSYARLMNNVGTTLYNAMIHPLIPYAFQGVIWYQGESNAGRAYQYRKTFPLMITDWRNRWKDVFPFLFVQLSSFGADQNSNEGSTWAELREAQSMTLNLPRTGMAVTTDIGNAADIHPRNKKDVGYRLAANALHNVYGQDLPFSGPVYQSVRFENGKATLRFDFADKGLVAKDKYGYLKGFEIAGADKKFYYAQATIIGNTITVHSPEVLSPVAVRYAWSDAPVEANLYNTEGFPASPFRTDTWPGITVGKGYVY